MEDLNIIEIAVKENASIISMDKDFGELVFKNKLSHKGIMLLKVEEAVAEEKLAAI
jgi:predicted nuclease of predicted toxin-antitoxin system